MSLGVWVILGVVLLGAALAWGMMRNASRTKADTAKDNSGRTSDQLNSKPSDRPPGG